ncbi:HEPN domain-containing protein [Sulfolobus sp. E5-1-F]|uniref:HEPN domain-containing protein n=1 Tax=Saccharolobus sp. E5-1-F TaxID=2663019 RepID=UPI0012972B2D|nr:HEPN domain-containing protein [Sulfolobus sp. E5-1-F]QGA55548.1 HEPN domain-containing protein [Sulfolobus sp. E5-1-F]
MSFLRVNAKQFLEQGKFSLQRGFYNLVLFNIEQSIQLNLKYLIYSLTGDFPKTQKISDLFKFIKILNNPCNLYDFYENNKDFISIIEFSYISSRYLPQSFSEEDAKKAIKLGEDFDMMIEQCMKVMPKY